MAIFSEAYVELLLEKKTTEEYHEDVFKKEFKFVPDKGSNGRSGTIESDGKKYHVTLDANKTGASIDGPNSGISNINLSKGFFRMKGSNQNERMKAVLQHEIGHQNLHNKNPDNKTVDAKNRSIETWKDWYAKSLKQKSGLDISDDKKTQQYVDNVYRNSKIPKPPLKYFKKSLYQSGGIEEYAKKSGTKQEQKDRDKDYQIAKKYEVKSDDNHIDAREFEADRFAANHTSERALKRGLREVNKQDKKMFDTSFSKDVKKHPDTPHSKKDRKEARAKDNNYRTADYESRSKALKDKDLKNAKTYK